MSNIKYLVTPGSHQAYGQGPAAAPQEMARFRKAVRCISGRVWVILKACTVCGHLWMCPPQRSGFNWFM